MLKNCHSDSSGIKSKAVLALFKSMMDNNKSHQVDAIKDLWRTQKIAFIKECQLGVFIHQEAIKECAFVILQVYLDGRSFGVNSLLVDDQVAC